MGGRLVRELELLLCYATSLVRELELLLPRRESRLELERHRAADLAPAAGKVPRGRCRVRRRALLASRGSRGRPTAHLASASNLAFSSPRFFFRRSLFAAWEHSAA